MAFPPNKDKTDGGGSGKGSPIAAILLHMKGAGGAEGKADGGPVDGAPPPDDGSGGGDLEMAAQDFVSAVQSGDAKSVASAFKAMFDICESQPHDEAGEDEGSEPPPGAGGEE